MACFIIGVGFVDVFIWLADALAHRIPPGARYDPVGPGGPRLPGGGGGRFGGAGGQPPNPFGGFGGNDFI